MNTLNLLTKFIDFEKKYNMFNLKTDNGIYWWDIARFSIYEELNNTFIIKDIGVQHVQNKYNLFFIFTTMLKDTLYLSQSIFAKKKFFFFLTSRSKDKFGRHFDTVSSVYLKTLPSEDIFYLETIFDAKTDYPSFHKIFLKIMKIFFKSKNHNINFEVNKLLNETFGTNIDFYTVIQNDLNNYCVEYKYYKKLLELIQPDYCFVVQNGIQKGLFSAANDLNIKSIELQHGQINLFNILYSYSNEIDYSHLNYFPKVLFTYSEYWNKTNYPVAEKISMGLENNMNSKNVKTSNDVAFIFASMYTETLLIFVKELAPKFEHKIYIKLHPNQKNEIQYIKQELKDNKNIEIIFIEKTMDEIFSLVSSIILIQSTTIYEALQKEKKVFLYKKQDYDTHVDVFENQNVYLIENVDEFLLHKDKPLKAQNKINFFDSFDQNKFASYIKEMK